MLFFRALDDVEIAAGGLERGNQLTDSAAIFVDDIEADDLVLIVLTRFQRGE